MAYKKDYPYKGFLPHYHKVEEVKVNSSTRHVVADIKGYADKQASQSGEGALPINHGLSGKLTPEDLAAWKQGKFNIIEWVYKKAAETIPFFGGQKEDKEKGIKAIEPAVKC